MKNKRRMRPAAGMERGDESQTGAMVAQRAPLNDEGLREPRCVVGVMLLLSRCWLPISGAAVSDSVLSTTICHLLAVERGGHSSFYRAPLCDD